MTKSEIKSAVNDLRNNVHYEGVSTEPLYGVALDDFPYGRYVRHEVVVNLLHWQCILPVSYTHLTLPTSDLV